MLSNPRSVLYDSSGNPLGVRANALATRSKIWDAVIAKKAYFVSFKGNAGLDQSFRFLFENPIGSGKTAHIFWINVNTAQMNQGGFNIRQNPTANLPTAVLTPRNLWLTAAASAMSVKADIGENPPSGGAQAFGILMGSRFYYSHRDFQLDLQAGVKISIGGSPTVLVDIITTVAWWEE